ncbi:hypothetical protein FNV43_RR00290 [Rhamnella rubrinervis]|uniref:PROP1-like PPR domain-containing protein n=1 Tax=Rhamnella rubrinervis TaxID=2594499 RepID=A0A8K0HNA5_9ROSA|nr:hypothetical protein FNV43_RR00290 [Rhamnella rubrinervis]
MLSKSQRLICIPKAHNFAIHILPFKPLCTTTESTEVAESPKLPSLSQLFNPKAKTPATEDSDDFVIPSLANWVETHKLNDQNEVFERFLGSTDDSDLDEISSILQNRDITMIGSRRLGFSTGQKRKQGMRISPELYNSMVDILGKAKNFQIMWDLVEEMEQLGGYVSMVTMARVIRRLAGAGMYKEAIEAFQGIDRYGISKDVSALNILLEALVKANRVEHAHEVVSQFQKLIPLNLKSYNILLYGWCKFRKLDNAKKTMEDMEKNGICPDVVSYTSLIKAYSGDKDFRKVGEILAEMHEKGCKPNTVTYTVVMHALGKAKQINEALEVYEKMKKNGCVPDASFYGSLIFILGRAGRLKDARDVFEDVTKQGVPRDLLIYNTMISCLCEHSQEEAALKLLKQMEEDSCKPDLKTYAPLLKMCCRKKRMTVLNFLLKHMLKNDVSIEVGTYSLLVHGLCKSGKVEEACSFFEEMVSKGFVPKDSTIKMLKERVDGKSTVEAKGTIEKLMLQAKEQIRTKVYPSES